MILNFRKAQTTDLPAILEIYQNAREFMRQSGNPNQWKNHHPSEEQTRSDIALGQLMVCTEQEKILAAFAYIPGIDPTYLYIEDGAWLNDEPYGVIHRIAVAVPGKGIAGQCFDWALQQCPNLRIDTHRDNRPMQKALQKHGFTRCGTIYLANGEDRIAYHKCHKKTEA